MSNTPNIRFSGYTDPWKQRKFSDFTWNAGKRNKDDLDLEPYAITNEHGFIRQTEAHDDFGYMKDTDRKAYNIVMPNSFAYNPARINVGSIGYYEGTENVIVSSLYEVFQTADYVDDRFLWHWFKSDEFPKWIGRLQEGSVRLYFYYDKLCECQMLMPSVPEQKRIAEILDGIDDLITLHQRKCDETKTLKKYMLKKMFPQNGALVPEIRFAGFNDPWKQRKLGEVLSFIKDGTHGTHPDTDEGPLLLSAKNIKNGRITWDDADRRISQDEYKKIHSTFILKSNDVLMTIVGSIGEAAILKNPEGITFQRSVAFLRPNEEITSEFLYSEILTSRFQKDLDSRKSTSAQPGIYLGDLSEIPFSFPGDLNEQEKIGSLLLKLDETITLHQRKCDELKEVKKYMLQNMFPQKG